MTLGANTVLTGTMDSFGNGVTGNGFDLALNFSSPTALNQMLTGIHNLSTGNGGITTISGNLTTSGSQLYNDAVTLVGATTLTSGPDVTFANLLDGAQTLAINAPGTTTFAMVVGGMTPLISLATAGGNTLINGGQVTTTRGQSYGGSVMLGADTVLTGGSVQFGNTVASANMLSVKTTGTAQFSGAVNVPMLALRAGSVTFRRDEPDRCAGRTDRRRRAELHRRNRIDGRDGRRVERHRDGPGGHDAERERLPDAGDERLGHGSQPRLDGHHAEPRRRGERRQRSDPHQCERRRGRSGG